MEKVFVDTNIVIDLLAKKADFQDAQDLFTAADRKEIAIYISSLTFANAYFSIKRHHKDVDARKYMAKFKVLVTVLPLEDKHIELSLASNFEDFEDGLQYAIAMDFDSDVIITRDKNDFKKSKIPTMTAGQFVRRK